MARALLRKSRILVLDEVRAFAARLRCCFVPSPSCPASRSASLKCRSHVNRIIIMLPPTGRGISPTSCQPRGTRTHTGLRYLPRGADDRAAHRCMPLRLCLIDATTWDRPVIHSKVGRQPHTATRLCYEAMLRDYAYACVPRPVSQLYALNV